jgi:predicted S18 family serine protease
MIQKDNDKEKNKEAAVEAVTGPAPASAAPATGHSPGAPRASVPAQPVKTPPAFLTGIYRVPVLMVNQLSAKQESQGFYAANRGELALVDLAVSHVASGTGPEVSTDSHFGGNIDVSLRAAVSAAAKAVGYDQRFLRVRLSVKTSILQSGLYIDGPSAGAVLAVGVAAALLGDQIRPDVCMSGTINENLDVGPVGGLEEKIKGCRQFNYREMVVPHGQTSMDLALKGMGGDIRITEVSTFDAAYQAATGQSIRPVPLP